MQESYNQSMHAKCERQKHIVFRKLLLNFVPTHQQVIFEVIAVAFDFDLIFGYFFTFWGPNGLFLGSG